jgi:hypothetical protein
MMKTVFKRRNRSLKTVLTGLFLSSLVALAPVYAPAEEKTEKQVFNHEFENSTGIFFWPNGTSVTLDTKEFKSGKSSITFTPDNHYTAYWYVDVEPGQRYKVSFWYRADKKMLARNGISISFNLPGQGNGSGGRTELSLGEGKADNQWHEFESTFDVPEKVTRIQFMLNFFRTISNVNVDDLKLTQLGPTPESAKAAKPTAAPAVTDAFSNGDFSQGLARWSSWFKDGEATAVVDNENKHEGKPSVRLAGGAGRHILAQRVAVEPGQVYTVSFWARTQNDTVGNSAVTLDFSPTNTVPRPYQGLQSLKGSVDWKKFSFQAEAPADAKFAYLCLIHGGGTINFANVKVEAE